MKQEHATYFWQRLQEPSGADWRRPFYAEFDALLAMARSIPELIQACFGMEETPSQHVPISLTGLIPARSCVAQGLQRNSSQSTARSGTCRSATDGPPSHIAQAVVVFRC
jgi:hypothetical protein